MGYQESYLRMKNSNDFDLLVSKIKNLGKEKFTLAMPVEIITLQEPISGDLMLMCDPETTYDFYPGEKFIYVCGERSHQSNSASFFQECIVDNYILENLEIYFTECFPSDDIFDTELQYASHEDFF